MIIMLDDWAVVTDDSNPYCPPERRQVCLQGIPQAHPTHGSGKRIMTSRIIGSRGRVVTTSSGRQYRLGRISPTYRAYLRKHRPNWNWRTPVQGPRI